MGSSYTGNLLCPVTIGRETELRSMEDRLHLPCPGTILIAGEAGIGKTRLTRELAERAKAVGFRAIRAECDERHTGFPFVLVRELLRALELAYPVETLAQLAGSHANALGDLLPEFAQFAPAGAQSDRYDLLDALDRIFAGVAAGQRLAVFVEDLHWCDTASLGFLTYLARHSAERPLALILTVRDDETEPDLAHMLAELARQRLTLGISLHGLSPYEIDMLLRSTLDLARPAPAALIHQLLRLTHGNPFFIEEVLTALGPAVLPTGTTSPSFDTLHLPQTVQDTVRRRTAGLDPVALQLLKMAAIVGSRFRATLVRDLSGIDERALVGALKSLTGANLIVEESSEWFYFRHALTRETVIAGLLARERQALHGKVVELLERDYIAAPEEVTSLAYHAHEAGDWERSHRYAVRAGDQAMALHAPYEAAEHYVRALEAADHLALPGDPRLLSALGAAREMMGDLDGAQSAFELARDRAQEIGDQPAEIDALLGCGLLWAARDYARAGASFTEALETAQSLGNDALVARCLNRLGNWHLNALQPHQAQRCHRQALAIMERLEDRHGIAETLDLLGLAALLGGDLNEGESLDTRAIALWRELGDRRGLASSLTMLSARGPTFHTDTVRAVTPLSDARLTADEAISIAREAGWRAGECWARWIAGGLVDGAAGSYANAFRQLQTARDIAEEIAHAQWQGAIHCMLGKIHSDLLNFEAARLELEQALRHGRTVRSAYWIQSATGWLGSTLVAAGALEEAATLLRSDDGPAPGMDSIAGRLCWRANAELALAHHDAAKALDIVDRMIATAPGASDQPVPTLELIRGRARTALEQFDSAETALRAACDTAASLGALPVVWRGQLELYRLYRATQRPEDAATAADATLGTIDALAAELDDIEVRSRFLNAATRYLPKPRHLDDALTPREREVATLVAQGHTNREIAGALYISEWTVATHVRNIFAKLEISSRSQIAAWVTAHDLAN